MKLLRCRGTVVLIAFLLAVACSEDPLKDSEPVVLYPECAKEAGSRTDSHTPESMVADWGQPVRLGPAINTPCPEDAIEVSGDGQWLYFMFTEDLLDSLSPDRILARENNTYRAKWNDSTGEFEQPLFYDLGKGTAGSLDGELSFTPDGSKVYFHSNRPENLGYQANPYTADFLDIYVADVVDGVPGPGVNLGSRVNSIYPDGEHAIHPDGVSLYFTSLRPGGLGGSDIYLSRHDDTGWTEPVNLDTPINSIFGDLQPTFTPDGDTMYYVSERNPLIGVAIYRSVRSGETWGTPELVIRGIVGEPSLTDDGQYLYFVHVLRDAQGNFDADVWVCERQ
jgi:Tol biopolymer transport system component